MNGINAFGFGQRDNSRNVQISLDRAFAGADLIGLVGLETVERKAIFLRIDGHGAQAEFVGRAKDANGDLAAIRGKQFVNGSGFHPVWSRPCAKP